jgi:hypothetical protein
MTSIHKKELIMSRKIVQLLPCKEGQERFRIVTLDKEGKDLDANHLSFPATNQMLQ